MSDYEKRTNDYSENSFETVAQQEREAVELATKYLETKGFAQFKVAVERGAFKGASSEMIETIETRYIYSAFNYEQDANSS